ncbi:MAG: hypothetical protein DPW21_00690 [Anaerolineae bacterium]|mgnify:CR=1 FL=1|nr:hypothetical protein [Chloroflexi bacterium CFX2]MCQ3945197.1 hypothetical protein [Anaerolineae bacterium]MCZ7547539.1 hypothetical protein [Anaerolineales bacterium]GER79118.1 conserved hypothetical protein [Candidatus Denitrolinea symbiosum]HPO85040.1 hypothetical protein [Candidatus Hydrogenedentota bacterium]
MFNDRDLGILGAGALLAVLSLFLPLSFAGKVVVGFLVLVAFMALALLRLGPDRVPPEIWLMRRFRYSMQTRQYVNQQEASRRAQPTQTSVPSNKKAHPPKVERSTPIPSVPVLRPLDLAWNEIGVYPLLTAFLAVVGVYFAVWLAQGGAQELSIWFQ